jgi:hypothetical protein
LQAGPAQREDHSLGRRSANDASSPILGDALKSGLDPGFPLASIGSFAILSFGHFMSARDPGL